MGNAVSPCVASALGRCLALAAVGAVPAHLDHAVLPVPDPLLIKVVTLRVHITQGVVPCAASVLLFCQIL